MLADEATDSNQFVQTLTIITMLMIILMILVSLL